MLLQDFDFQFPPELIANYPCARGEARLMVVHRKSKEIHHTTFPHILDFLDPGDLLVLNNTKVIPARLFGQKETGGKVEVFLLQSSPRKRGSTLWKCLIHASVRVRCGQRIYFRALNPSAPVAKCIEINSDGTCLLEFEKDFPFEKLGHIPLPPYIQRKDEEADQTNYQTVFAKHEGAVAAPTAGLHWTEELLNKAQQKGIEIAEVTLHVGLGTFQPIRTENILDHKMHAEYYEVSKDALLKMKEAKRVVCVGTTSVRVAETIANQTSPQMDSCASWLGGGVSCDTAPPALYFRALNPSEVMSGWTNLYITPGYSFKNTHALQTNFHQPKSSLFVLVSSFAGCDLMQKAYQEAIAQKYRLFSYGDTMLVL